MKICFFGSYDRTYPKNVVLLNGFKKLNLQIIHCHHPQYFTLTHYPSLFWQFIKKGRKADLIFVAFFGHYDVWFAWVLGKLFQKKVVFDPLISIYNTRVEDRKYFKEGSLRANFYRLFDWVNLMLSDRVFIDTEEHFKYYNKMFGLSKSKTDIVRVGADEQVLVPSKIKLNKKVKKILFYGSYQPSQGVYLIIQVANYLKNKNIDWIFIGNGQDRAKVENYAKKNKLKKVSFLDPMPFTKLVIYIDTSDIVFGIFGDTIKSNMVIHNKIFQGIAMEKVVITQDTKVVREILTNEVSVILLTPDPKKIGDKITELITHRGEMIKIAKEARRVFLKSFTSTQVAKQAIDGFNKTLRN
jgi:glycosyltransferase involved in cell wall biosynthesis